MRTQIKESLEELKKHWTVGELQVSYNTNSKIKLRINGPEDAFRIFRAMWDDSMLELQEQFSAIFLNRNLKVIGYRNISTGTNDRNIVDIPLLLSLALLCRASSVVVAHNHPSKSLSPSTEDRNLTSEIKYALGRIHVKLQDSLIITGNSGFSILHEEEITLGAFDDLHDCDSCILLKDVIQLRDEELEFEKRITGVLEKRIIELKKQLNDARKTIRQHKSLLTA